MFPLYPGTPVETFLDNGERVMATPVYAFDMKALIFRAVRDNQPRVVEYLLNISTGRVTFAAILGCE